MTELHELPTPVTVPIAGTAARFAVAHIYCVGRNYAEHVREMGGDPERTPPVFFMKPTDAVIGDGANFPYPPRSTDVHYEVELVVALERGGRDISPADALNHVYGYAVGNDWTRRDLQAAAKRGGQPWDMAKAFDHSASLGPIVPVKVCGHPARGTIALSVNGVRRQHADLGALIWDVAAVIAELSTYVTLKAGDLIYTGTPEGVGAVQVGDLVVASIDGLGTLTNRVVQTQ